MWLAYHTASQRSLKDLSSIIHIDDRITQRTFETIMTRELPEDYIQWVHDEDSRPSLHQLPDMVVSARCLETLLDRDQDRAKQTIPAYWFSNTIQYAESKVWKMDRLNMNPRARVGRYIHDRHWHGGKII